MSYAPQLPPVGHIHFPVPIFEPSLAFPAEHFENSAPTRVENLERSIPQPISQIPATRNAGPTLSQLSRKKPTPTAVSSKSSKVLFSFVEVHESSGKLNTATSSHVRSVVMRKYHEKRRSLQRPGKNRQRLIAASCQHEEHMHAIDNPSEDSKMFQRRYSDAQPAETYSLPAPNTPPSSPDVEPKIEAYQAPRIVATSDAICAQCGWVMHQTPLNSRGNQIVERLGDPRTLLNNYLPDPFDSCAIPLTPRTQELAHHCKSSQAHPSLLFNDLGIIGSNHLFTALCNRLLVASNCDKSSHLPPERPRPCILNGT